MTDKDAGQSVLERVMSVTRRGAVAGTVIAAAACSASAASAPGPGRFRHGVASGDPLPRAVIIWTRLEPEGPDVTTPLDVEWMVATDDSFARPVRRGRTRAEAANDWCVKVDVTGLRPGQRYVYRFSHGAEQSPVGVTRTAPADSDRPAQLTTAVISCSNHPAGYFNVYRAIAQRGDVDLVLHLGDYIYEYGAGGYATEFGRRVGRVPDPTHEIVSLDDYRRRYRQYRSDPDLQAAHACAPWLVTWDDHEFTNDAWMSGAENHIDASEGPWTDRKAAALRAYYEWMPLRPPSGRGLAEINRHFTWGKLATIAMLETRVTGRDRVLEPAEELPATATDAEAAAAALDRFKSRIADPARQMLGPAQETWLSGVFQATTAREAQWCILANQVILAKVPAPDFGALLPPDATARLVAAVPQARAALELAKQGLPLNLDAWDGYPAARERLFESAAAAGVKLVTVTGDTHASWANHLRDRAGALRGVEFGCPSVTSPDFADLFNALGLDGSVLGPVIKSAAPDVVWHDEGRRGFVLARFTPQAAEATFITVNTIHSQEFTASTLSRWRWEGDAEGLSRIEG